MSDNGQPPMVPDVPQPSFNVTSRQLVIPFHHPAIGVANVVLSFRQLKSYAAQLALLEAKAEDNIEAAKMGLTPPHELPPGWREAGDPEPKILPSAPALPQELLQKIFSQNRR